MLNYLSWILIQEILLLHKTLHSTSETHSWGPGWTRDVGKTETISLRVYSWFSPVDIVPEKAQPGEQPQMHLCVDYHACNSLLLPVVKPSSKAQGVLALVPLLKVIELYAMLNGSTVYSPLDCTSGYHDISLSPEVQKKCAFVTLISKFEFKKVPCGLAQGPIHFQQFINEVLKGFLFCFWISRLYPHI